MAKMRPTSIATLISVACHLGIFFIPPAFVLRPQPLEREVRLVLKFGKELPLVPKATLKRGVIKPKPKPLPKQSVKKPKPVIKEQQIIEMPPELTLEPEEEIVLEEEVASIEPSIKGVPASPKVCEEPSGDSGVEGMATGTGTDRYLHFLDLVMRQIEATKRYPPRARKQGFEGIVQVQFQILHEGQCKDVKVMNSSGFNILDQAAEETIKRASPFPSPKMINREMVDIKLAIIFDLK